MNNTIYQQERIYPKPEIVNIGIYYVGAGSAVPFSALALCSLPDLHVTGAGSGGQFFPRHTYEPTRAEGQLEYEGDDLCGSYRRVDNITDSALREYRVAYGDHVTKDNIFHYVYGLLHSTTYRSEFAADLKKMLPRIPLVRDFAGFTVAGRELAELHLNYESVKPYALEEIVTRSANEPDLYRVKKMSFARAGKEKDRSRILYNSRITVAGIPEGAYRYTLGSRSAIEWIMDRYQVKTDKASGIVNDPNDWATEHNEPRYILDLLKRIVTVSVETMKIVDELPPLDILTTDS